MLYTEDGEVAKELKAAAEKQGLKGKKAEEWVNRRVDDLRRSHGAYEGSLGKDISAEARSLQAGAMIYQTLRLLPLMIFSSMMDPNGIRVAGGTSEDMWNAYKRGFAGRGATTRTCSSATRSVVVTRMPRKWLRWSQE